MYKNTVNTSTSRWGQVSHSPMPGTPMNTRNKILTPAVGSDLTSTVHWFTRNAV